MPFELGNMFGSKYRRAAPVEHSQAQSPASRDGAQAALERAANTHTTKNDELSEARSRLAELDQIVGEKLADDLDAAPEVLARQSAQARVTQLELAVGILCQRQQDAATALKAAEQAAADDAVSSAHARLAALGPVAEALFAEVKRFRTNLARETENLRVCGGNSYVYSLSELTAQFDLFMKIANRPPSADAFDSGAYRKYPNFLACAAAHFGEAPDA